MKCEFCSKKIKMISFDCKCAYKQLCTNCRYPETHQCKSIEEIKEEEKRMLKINNPVIVPQKLLKI